MVACSFQEIGRLPVADEKIDCISVGFSPVRSEIENLNRKYWDALVTTLQRSIVNDIDGIDKFANNAMDTLRRQPQVRICLIIIKYYSFF